MKYLPRALWRGAAFAAFGCGLVASAPVPGFAQTPPTQVKFYGAPTAIISSGVIIPPNYATVWISGTTPPVLKTGAPAGSRERFGDTRTQAAGILKALGTQLEAQGLAMKDVVYVRAYLVPDPANAGKIDVAGWNAAFREVFGTDTTPTKPARSTVGVVALVNSDFLIEIEAFAAFPTP